MDSKEFGLVAAQQLLQIDYLHYGFWQKGTQPSIGAVAEAQHRYTSYLCDHVAAHTQKEQSRILDAGCGTGSVLKQLLAMGYHVDGLVPSAWMAQKARESIAPYATKKINNKIFECTFEAIPINNKKEHYDLVFFSESYQYINMQEGFDRLNQILSNSGSAIILDFFKKDGVKGTSPLGGGHLIKEFYSLVKRNGFIIDSDIDVTENMSPNLALLNELLVNRFIPFFSTLDAFLSSRYKKTYSLVRWLARKRIKKWRFKYSKKRDEANFKKYKTYRLIVLKRTMQQ